MVVFGQNINNIQGFFATIDGLLRYAGGVVIAIGLLFFLWGVIKFIFNANNPAKRKDGINFIIYGLVSFFVIFSVWGLVRVIRGVFDPRLF